ncbi:D-alanyl-D-alanine carboxypeptidase DacD precursor [compost metagenome]
MSDFQIQRRNHLNTLSTSSKKSHRWQIGLVLTVVLLLAIGSYRFASADTSVSAVSTYVAPAVIEKQPLDWPSYGQAAIATRDYGVLETHGVIKQHPTASTAKLITMLAVMERKPFELGMSGETLVLDQTDVDLYDHYIANNGSNAPVQLGERITQRQAMQGVLLVSSNNLADSLAIWAFGSLEAYRVYATDMIQRFGLKDTVIGSDASGLDASTLSTAADLAIIAQKALEQPVIASIASQQTATIPVAGQINNTNFLLGDDGVIGLKTGESVEAGGNFILAANHTIDGHTQQIIIVIMGADLSRIAQQDSYKLYISARDNFKYVVLAKKGQEIGAYTPGWSKRTYSAVAKNEIGAFIWPGMPVTPAIQLDIVRPESKDTSVGVVKFKVALKTQESPIILAQSIDEPSMWWRAVAR